MTKSTMTDTTQPTPAFLKRLAELENAVELSAALANQAEELERRLLGHREDGTPTQGGPAHVPTSFNDALEVHAINIDMALERISDSLDLLVDASRGVPLEQEPLVDEPARGASQPPRSI